MNKPKWKSSSMHGKKILAKAKEGKIGKGCMCDNTHLIEIGYHYNGSGKQAFGGAEKWPSLKIQIDFEEGQEDSAKLFLKKLQPHIDILLQEFKNE